MAILTGYHPTTPFRYVVWQGRQQDLVDITALIRWTPPEEDGVLYVHIADGSMQPVKAGWAVYVEGDRAGVAAADVVASWRPGDASAA